MSEPTHIDIEDPQRRGTVWRRPDALFAIVLLTTVVVQVAYVFTCSLDLAGDVAHVWTWSRRLDISYYSKPPMVAYVVRLATLIGGDRPEAIRLMAVAMGLMTIGITYALARRMFDAWVALTAVLAMSAAPIFSAGSILLTTDAPMFLCWAATTLLVYIAMFEEKRWAWYAAGLALLCGALSKLTMLIFVPSLAVYLLIWGEGHRRRVLRSHAPWVGLATGLLALVPVIVWNASRGWATFDHLLVNNAGAGKPWAGIEGLALFFGLQLAVVNPLVFGGYVAGMFGSIARGVRRGDRRYWYLVCLSVPMMLFYLVLSIKKKPLPNWPVAAYFTGLIAAAAVLVEWLRAERVRGDKKRSVRNFCIATLAVGLVTMVVFRHTDKTLYPLTAWANRKWGWNVEPRNFDPTYKLHGFRELAEHAEQYRAKWAAEAKADGKTFFIFADDRQLASELAFYLPGHPVVYRAYNHDRHVAGGMEEADQFRFWPGSHDDPKLHGADAIYIAVTDKAEEFAHCFDSLDPIGPEGETRPPYYALRIHRGGLLVRSFHIRRFRGYNRAVLQWEPDAASRPAATLEATP